MGEGQNAEFKNSLLKAYIHYNTFKSLLTCEYTGFFSGSTYRSPVCACCLCIVLGIAGILSGTLNRFLGNGCGLSMSLLSEVSEIITLKFRCFQDSGCSCYYFIVQWVCK